MKQGLTKALDTWMTGCRALQSETPHLVHRFWEKQGNASWFVTVPLNESSVPLPPVTCVCAVPERVNWLVAVLEQCGVQGGPWI
jgi:hypothetical protein